MIVLPIPPSLNGMYRNVPKIGRVKTREYKAWEKEAAKALTFAAWDCPVAPYEITIRININHRGDIDNRVKPILDLLVRHKVLTGDQWVNALHVYRDRSIQSCTVAFG